VVNNSMSQNNALPPQQRASQPDYTLRAPTYLGYVLGLGLLSGIGGLVLNLTGPEGQRPVAYALLVIGVLVGLLALLIFVATGSRGRLRVRQQMLNMVPWRGDEKVLDVGCGNGFLLVEAAKHLTTGQAIGIDIWMADAGRQTIDAARRNAQIAGVADKVEVKNADARRMPFDDNTFDVILSSLMLHHAGSGTDRQRVIQEMSRVVKPGGRIILYDMSPFIAVARQEMREQGDFQINQVSGFVMKVISASKTR
jgi:SAM-dependent methyltransferase